jgi:hypothetical protein
MGRTSRNVLILGSPVGQAPLKRSISADFRRRALAFLTSGCARPRACRPTTSLVSSFNYPAKRALVFDECTRSAGCDLDQLVVKRLRLRVGAPPPAMLGKTSQPNHFCSASEVECISAAGEGNIPNQLTRLLRIEAEVDILKMRVKTIIENSNLTKGLAANQHRGSKNPVDGARRSGVRNLALRSGLTGIQRAVASLGLLVSDGF